MSGISKQGYQALLNKAYSTISEIVDIADKENTDSKTSWLANALSSGVYESQSFLIAEKILEHINFPAEALECV